MEKTQKPAEYVRAQPAAKPLPKNKLFAIVTWLLDWNHIPHGVKRDF